MQSEQITFTGDYPAHYTPLRLLTPLEMALRAERLHWEDGGAKYVTILKYEVVPFPQGRARGTVIRIPNGKHVCKIYADPDTAAYQKDINAASKKLMDDMAVIEGVRLGAKIDFVTDGRNEDLDNLLKALLDGMQGAVFKNDNAFDYLSPMRHISKTEPAQIIALILAK